MTTPKRLSFLVVPLLVAASLSGCGGGDDGDGGASGADGGGSSVTVLTDEQAEAALLSETNVGAGFVVAPDDEDEDEAEDDEEGMGCLDGVDALTDQGAETEEEIDFEAANDLGLPQLSSGVASFGNEEDLAEALEGLRARLEDCTSVDETDAEGTRTRLELSVTDDAGAAEADDQVAVSAVGTISTQGLDAPFALSARFVRVENQAVFVAYADLAQETPAALDAVTQAAVDRLAAVVAGEEPSEEPISELAGLGAGAAR